MSRISHAAAAAVTAATVVVTATPASAWVGGSVSATSWPSVQIQSGTAPITCDDAGMTGSITSGGTLSISQAFFYSCRYLSSSISVQARNLPWGGSLIGGNAQLLGVTLAIGFPLSGSFGCSYSPTISLSSFHSMFAPVTASFTGNINKISGSGFCPPTLYFNGSYLFNGPGL